ncbi:MAG: M48 family metallopeptidase [Aquabacterium sp.]
MLEQILAPVFISALVASLLLQLWLLGRQIRHVRAHRDAVPPAFAARVALPAHQRAADYTVAKGRLALLALGAETAILLGWTWLGGLDTLNTFVRDALAPSYGPMVYQLGLLTAVMLIGGVLDLPFSAYGTFVIEQRFGFNRTSVGLWLADMAKGLVVAALLGLPLAASVLWLMASAGAAWWWWAWCVWMGFNALVLVLYPTLIAPWFNRFVPLEDAALKTRVEALMARCGFAAKGLFVMDGSRRSSHGNAYFTGLGAAKRVVFFDTLLKRLEPGEVEAVLAHELGHFKRRHISQRIVVMAAASMGGLALLGWLSGQPGFYAALGVQPNLGMANDALALLLFMMVMPVFGFLVSPTMAAQSRRHEFEADAFAGAHARADDLASALVKLHEDNAATLTPDPWYVRFHYSHPPAGERIAALSPSSGTA